MLPIGNILHELHINFHLFADDAQIYIHVQTEDPSIFILFILLYCVFMCYNPYVCHVYLLLKCTETLMILLFK